MKWMIVLSAILTVYLTAPLGHTLKIVPCDDVSADGSCGDSSGSGE